jgi:hypothetical protein
MGADVNFANTWSDRFRQWKSRKPNPEHVKSVSVRLPVPGRRQSAIQLSPHFPKPAQVEALEQLEPSGRLVAILCSTSNLATAATRYLEELHRNASGSRLRWKWDTFRATGYLSENDPPQIDEAMLPGAMYAESVTSSENVRELGLQLDYGKLWVGVKISFDVTSDGGSRSLTLESVTPLLSSFDVLTSEAETEDVRKLEGLFERFCSHLPSPEPR